MELQSGLQVGGGRYELVSPLGEGGQAEVWLAKQLGMGGFSRDVALKFVRVDKGDSSGADQMLLQEAQLISQIKHPNIVEVYDIGREEDWLFVAMELIRGKDLEFLLKCSLDKFECPMPWPFAVAILIDVCNALQLAHNLKDHSGKPLGLIHRDLKPENILMSQEGFVKIIDFGIAKAENRANKTKTGHVKGTPAFMSPEQISSKKIDARSDLFSLGAILYELTSGHRAFIGEDLFSLLFTVIGTTPVRPREHLPAFPAELEDVIFRLLEKEPKKRFQTAQELRVALDKELRAKGLFLGQDELSEFYRCLVSDDVSSAGSIFTAYRFSVDDVPVVLSTVSELDTDARGVCVQEPADSHVKTPEDGSNPVTPTGSLLVVNGTPSSQLRNAAEQRHDSWNDPVGAEEHSEINGQNPAVEMGTKITSSPYLKGEEMSESWKNSEESLDTSEVMSSVTRVVEKKTIRDSPENYGFFDIKDAESFDFSSPPSPEIPGGTGRNEEAHAETLAKAQTVIFQKEPDDILVHRLPTDRFDVREELTEYTPRKRPYWVFALVFMGIVAFGLFWFLKKSSQKSDTNSPSKERVLRASVFQKQAEPSTGGKKDPVQKRQLTDGSLFSDEVGVDAGMVKFQIRPVFRREPSQPVKSRIVGKNRNLIKKRAISRRKTHPMLKRYQSLKASVRRAGPTRGRIAPPRSPKHVNQPKFYQLFLHIRPACKLFEGHRLLSAKGASVLDKKPGTYHFRCVNRKRLINHRFRVRVRSGSSNQYRKTLSFGRLIVHSKPWSKVFLVPFGQIGFSSQPITLPVGTHHLIFYKKGDTSLSKKVNVHVTTGALKPVIIRW